jgi:hypothetical protein
MGDKRQHFLTIFHERIITHIGLIPFQKSVLRQVLLASFMTTVDFTDLKDLGVTRSKESFHTQFRGGVKEKIPGGDDIDMALRGRGGD